MDIAVLGPRVGGLRGLKCQEEDEEEEEEVEDKAGLRPGSFPGVESFPGGGCFS